MKLMLKAGLLTYSRFSVFPYRVSGTVTYRLKNVIELTAAGQLQIYTVFPFNPDFTSGTKSSANVVKRADSRKCVAWSVETQTTEIEKGLQ